jgi:hypothetical protein
LGYILGDFVTQTHLVTLAWQRRSKTGFQNIRVSQPRLQQAEEKFTQVCK